MTDTPKRGFEIGGRFYELVPITDWRNGDFVLARELTRLTSDELFSPDADYNAVQQAFLAVAFWHARPTLRMEKVIDAIYALKPSQIEEVGFDEEPEADAGPPDEEDAERATASASSRSSVSSSA